MTNQTILVHELAGDLHYDNTYLSSFNIKNLAFPDVLGSTEFIPRFRTDSTRTDTTAQIIRIRLNPSLGDRLLKMDSLNMVSNDEFLKVFKGVVCRACYCEQ